MVRAAMPVASVYEHDDALRAEGKIRFAKNPGMSPPSSDLRCPQESDECDLSCFVPPRPYARHDLRAFCSGEYICHGT